MYLIAVVIESKAQSDRLIRVEFWIAEKVHSLLYRMLVLNTGQVPWSLRRQIEVVFHSLKKDMIAAAPNLNLIEVDDGNRRRNGGTFQADKLIEIFLILGTRTERVDVKEKLADDFLKLDFIESSSDNELTVIFFKLLKVIVDFDLAISDAQSSVEGRFTHGYELFASQPLLTGFALASSIFILGRPGTTRTPDELSNALSAFETGFQTLLEKIEAMNPAQKESFLALEFLNEQMKSFKSGSKVGDEERNFFKTAFRVIFQDNFEIPSMEVCWRV